MQLFYNKKRPPRRNQGFSTSNIDPLIQFRGLKMLTYEPEILICFLPHIVATFYYGYKKDFQKKFFSAHPNVESKVLQY